MNLFNHQKEFDMGRPLWFVNSGVGERLWVGCSSQMQQSTPNLPPYSTPIVRPQIMQQMDGLAAPLCCLGWTSTLISPLTFIIALWFVHVNIDSLFFTWYLYLTTTHTFLWVVFWPYQGDQFPLITTTQTASSVQTVTVWHCVFFSTPGGVWVCTETWYDNRIDEQEHLPWTDLCREFYEL